MTAGFQWTAEAKDYLRELWLADKSASKIVTAFGVRFACAPPTRNAVLGTAHRMGLPARKSPITRRPEGAPPKPEPKRRAPVAPKAGPGVADLTPSMCRYPHGHPHQPESFFFCAAAVARPGLPYCAEHMARCYRPAGSKDTDADTVADVLGEVVDKPKVMTRAQRMARLEHAQRIYGQGRAA